MSTLKELVDTVAYNIGKQTDYTAQQAIKLAAISSYAMWMRRDYDKTGMFRASSIKAICMDTVSAAITECCSSPINCKIIKTSSVVPKPISVKDRLDFEYVGAIDKSNPFGYITPSQIAYINTDRFSKGLPLYTYMNDLIYMFNVPKSLKQIEVRLVPANPLQLDGLQKCNGGCFSLDEDIYLEEDLLPLVKNDIYRELNLVLKEDTEITVE